MKLDRQLCALAASIALSIAGGAQAQAKDIDWSGYTWNISTGRIGQGLVSGDPGNVLIDGNGYLHLKMVNSGGKWSGAELATSKAFGFGTFYWVFSAPVKSMEPQVVLAGFTYGPQIGTGIDGQNEIDVEFSKWNAINNKNNVDFDIYPPPGALKGANVEYDLNYTGSDTVTVRVDWSAAQITETLWSGVVPITASTKTADATWTYNGDKSTIPQAACPFMFNLWTFKTLPTVPIDAIVQSFQYVPATGK